MVERWYFIRNKVRVGPVTREELLVLVGTGELQPTHKLMKEGSGRWLLATETPGLFPGQGAAPATPAKSVAAAPAPARPQPAVPPASPALAALPPKPAAPPVRPPAAASTPAAPPPPRPAVPARPAAMTAPAVPAKPPVAPAKPIAPTPAAMAPPAKPPAAPVKPAAVLPAAAPPVAPAKPAPTLPASPPAAAAKPAAAPALAAPTAPPKPAAPPAPLVAGWFYVQDKKKLGPVTTVDLKKLAATGGLRTGDMVMRPGQNKWRPAGEIPGLFPTPTDETVEDEDEVEVADDEEADEDEVADDDDSEDAEDEGDEVDVDEYLERASACKAKGNYAGAIAEYEALVKMLPDEPEGYNGLAWVWATCPDAKVRNGAKAVEHARMAVELAENAEGAAEDEEEEEDALTLRLECQETLAAAQAEAGNFSAAVATLDSLLADADPDELPRLKQLRQQLQAKQPVRESGKTPSDSKR